MKNIYNAGTDWFTIDLSSDSLMDKLIDWLIDGFIDGWIECTIMIYSVSEILPFILLKEKYFKLND